MSKLNPVVKTTPFSTERLAGGTGMLSAKQDNLSLLRRVTLANLLWEDVAYVDGLKVSEEIERLIPLCNPKDVANLIVEARKSQKLRHTPLFMIVALLKHPDVSAKTLVKDILPSVVTRADMITDLFALYFKLNPSKDGKRPSIPNSLKKGMSSVFNSFNEYQLAKYDRDSAVKLRDVMFLTHPTPEQGKEELFEKIANRTLKTPDTWEVALSAGADKKEVFTRLINEGKLGGLAMLRNISNMVKAEVDHNIIRKGLKDIKSTMLLPINFLTARQMNPEYSLDIERAMLESYKNLPRLKGRTLLIVDVSGSMGSIMSQYSRHNFLDQACSMAMLAVNQCESFDLVSTAGNDSSGKGSHLHIKNPELGFGIAKQLQDTRSKIGQGGIFTRQCLEWCKENVGDSYDRIIVISDSQDCDRVNRTPNPYGKYNYIVDISSNIRGINYKGKWTAEISGLSEHFITFINAIEGNENKFEN